MEICNFRTRETICNEKKNHITTKIRQAVIHLSD